VDGLWAKTSEGVGLIVRAISSQDFQPMRSWSTNVTDGRTERQTDDMQSQYRDRVVQTRNTGPCSQQLSVSPPKIWRRRFKIWAN